MFNPDPPFEKVGCCIWWRAALTLPSGVEEVVIPAVIGEAAEAEMERGERRGGSRDILAKGAIGGR